MSRPKKHMSTITSWFAMAALAAAMGCAPTDESGEYLDAEGGVLEAEAEPTDEADDGETEKLWATKVCAPKKTNRFKEWQIDFGYAFKDGQRACRVEISVDGRWRISGRLRKRFLGQSGVTSTFQNITRDRTVCVHYSPSCITISNVSLPTL